MWVGIILVFFILCGMVVSVDLFFRARFQYRRAEFFREKGDMESAIACYLFSFRLNGPFNVWAKKAHRELLELAGTMEEKGKYTKAIEIYRELTISQKMVVGTGY